MKQRIITAIGIILVVALPVALGGLWLETLALFIVCASAYEWMHIQPNFKKWPLSGSLLTADFPRASFLHHLKLLRPLLL